VVRFVVEDDAEVGQRLLVLFGYDPGLDPSQRRLFRRPLVRSCEAAPCTGFAIAASGGLLRTLKTLGAFGTAGRNNGIPRRGCRVGSCCRPRVGQKFMLARRPNVLGCA
jgi:hypothetical protein